LRKIISATLYGMRVRDINNVQCLILYSIAGDEISVGELTQRSYLLGSNVFYNLKKMAEAGYLDQQRAEHDRRSIHIRLTEKGEQFWQILHSMFERHAGLLHEAEIEEQSLANVSTELKSIERFWNLVRTRVPRVADPLVGRPLSTEEASDYFHSQRTERCPPTNARAL
jgi:DNA-binding MarR family transcriptional regulator